MQIAWETVAIYTINRYYKHSADQVEQGWISVRNNFKETLDRICAWEKYDGKGILISIKDQWK